MQIMALDPGGVHVGVVFLQGSLKWAMEWTPSDLFDFMHEVDPLTALDVIIYEGFRLRELEALLGERFLVVEMIGAIKYWAHDHPCLVEQQPSIKQAWSDAELLHHFVVKLPASSHARDALRHLAHYLAVTKHWELFHHAHT